jgi:hypothetical protein
LCGIGEPETINRGGVTTRAREGYCIGSQKWL